ncbi:DUF4383 domain-containing protein [Citricoccus sp. SGAir0253]|uniref:DUF4383 domain-containing protein n=1 Tax=Citricoccus sp. SGAir0253 TaxID=2567881 RepID=UPI0010CCFA9A|nr:DUF4383 domain-containing protein [Citricoccus sp. SGAir0253]QCU79162.1 DUF4383 domain-containing protein [Citricoccus sp. SGAir0253]
MSTAPGRSPTGRTHAGDTTHRSPVQVVALLYGIVFLLVGIAGFIPGLTTNYDSLQFAGHQSEAMLLGIFQVSILHNVVHLLYGIAGLALSRTGTAARQFLLWGGIVYLVLWLYGLFVGQDSPANFVPLNSPDNWLHLALGVTMVALSFLPRRTTTDHYAADRP